MNKTFFIYFVLCWIISVSIINSQTNTARSKTFELFPKDKATNLNPDTHLQIIFNSTPSIGNSGKIRIYDASNNRLVDSLDMSILPGPTKTTPSPNAIYTPVPYKYVSGHFTNANTKPGTPSGKALPTPNNYQLTIIGGFTDGFHFYPIIVHGDTATIYLHNNLLQYDKKYYVRIDPGVLTLTDKSFNGITGKNEWSFSTKKIPPHADSKRLVVSADGSGDFNTVQGALDFIPDYDKNPVTIFIKDGTYEEIVYFRNKTNITIIGEDRDKVIVQYANNEIFNPHPLNIKTNEMPGTFPSRRAAFEVDHCSKIKLVNLTVKTTAYGQAEGLLINGDKIIVCDVTIVGSGDALQSNGSVYYTNCRIDGLGDTILGRGPAFFNNCTLTSFGPFMWIRNTSANHGNVFVNCKFITQGKNETVIARAPTNGGKSYTNCEAVLLNCGLKGISPVGWGPVGGETSNIHYWEYNSTNLTDDKPIDVSKRLPASRQLTMEKDSAIITNYMKPSYVLNGWTPEMVPLILSQPKPVTTKTGQTVTFQIKAAAIPKASYQWFKNGKAIIGAVNPNLNITDVNVADGGDYSVIIKNVAGSIRSEKATLTIK